MTMTDEAKKPDEADNLDFPRVDLSEWLGPTDLADEFKVPVRTIYTWRSQGTGPKAARFGKHLRYRRRDVEEWIANQYEDTGPAE